MQKTDVVKEITENRRVQLKNLLEEKIIIESESTDYDNSVFTPIYNKARGLVDSIKKHKIQDRKNMRMEELQIVNTISFEGRRGTGKTSAMMSFCKELEKDEDHDYIVLDYIDASALEEGESILEIVLANMYHELEKHNEANDGRMQNDFTTRNILRKFEDVFAVIRFIGEHRNKNGRRVDLSPLSGLERLSNSRQLKKEVYNLIEMFVGYIAPKKDAMLVIPIDDIDMCFHNESPSVYDIMETIHRYLMIPRVVILMTYDYPELLSGVEKHYSQMYYQQEKILPPMENHIREVANRYLEKVLPTYARIHLPSQQKRDYSDQNNIQICMDMKEKEEKDLAILFEPYFEQKDRSTITLNPKQFALLLKASNFGIYYDSQGKKRHYAEPSDFRDMVHIVSLCRQLRDTFYKNNKAGDEIVFKELLDDLYFRFARIKLEKEEYETFNDYLRVNIERRSRDILDEIWKKMETNENTKNRIKEYGSQIEIIGNEEHTSYSFGEMLYGLYRASSNQLFTKPMIWCILDSYTIMLTKLCRAVKREETQVKVFEEKTINQFDANAYETVKSIIGPSISSSWSNCFIPQISSAGMSTRIGAIKYTTRKDQYYFHVYPIVKKEDGEGENKKEYISYENMLKAIEIMCMFFTDVKNKNQNAKIESGFKIEFVPESDKVIKGTGLKERSFLKFSFDSACFNIMNFVNNLFAGEEFFASIHNSLENPLRSLVNLETASGEKKVENINKFFTENSLKKDFDNWRKENGRYAMPVYSFDMMYNILKRQYQNKKPSVNTVEVSDFLGYLKQVYRDIGEALSDQEKFYFNNSSEPDMHKKNECDEKRFSKSYAKSPFISYMNDTVSEGSEAEEYLVKFFREIAFSVAWSYKEDI